MQQRVVKRVVLAGDTTRTYYIRDAQGNTMGVYTRHNDSVSWREQYIFGSSRLGLYRADTLVNKGLTVISKLYEGKRNYELTNHLGNVMAVINDRKTDSLSGTTKVGFNAVVISATDYYPFGMAIDSRSYTSSLYRYGFNTQERENEINGNTYSAEFWEYDARSGRRWNIDPITYSFQSSYATLNNNPIIFEDKNGLYGSKGSAEKFRERAKRAGKEVGEVYQSGKEWGFYTYDPQKSGTKDKDGSSYSGGHEFNKRYFGNAGQRVADFFKDINPFKNLEVYASGVIKQSFENEKIPNTTLVIPYGGGQLAWSSDRGGNVRVLTAADNYVNVKTGRVDVRVMPTNGLVRIQSDRTGAQGDWDPNLRVLYTLHKVPIMVPIFDVPIKVGDYKIQGDAVFGLQSTRLGIRGTAETLKLFNIFSIEVAAGARVELKIPDILKD